MLILDLHDTPVVEDIVCDNHLSMKLPVNLIWVYDLTARFIRALINSIISHESTIVLFM
jgi:hypothetical protein